MTARRLLALGVFGVRMNARLWLTRAGAIVAATVIMAGPLLSVATGAGWALDPEPAFYGIVLALVFGLRSGLQAQRETDFDLFLARNLLSRAEHAGGVLVSLLLTFAAITAGTLLVLLCASAGDIGTAVWHTTAWLLRSAVLLGFVPLVERTSSVRLPFLLPLIGNFFVLIGLSLLVGEERALELLVVVRREEPASLVPLAVHAGTALVIGFGVFLAEARFRDRLRRSGPGSPRSAVEVPRRRHGVPGRHGWRRRAGLPHLHAHGFDRPAHGLCRREEELRQDHDRPRDQPGAATARPSGDDDQTRPPLRPGSGGYRFFPAP